MTVWDADNLNAPHTEREIAMIEDSGSASNIKKPDIAMRYDFDAGSMHDGARHACDAISARIRAMMGVTCQ